MKTSTGIYTLPAKGRSIRDEGGDGEKGEGFFPFS